MLKLMSINICLSVVWSARMPTVNITINITINKTHFGWAESCCGMYARTGSHGLRCGSRNHCRSFSNSYLEFCIVYIWKTETTPIVRFDCHSIILNPAVNEDWSGFNGCSRGGQWKQYNIDLWHCVSSGRLLCRAENPIL